MYILKSMIWIIVSSILSTVEMKLIFAYCVLHALLCILLRTDLRVCSGDVFIESLVMVDCVFQILKFRGQLSFATCLTPWLYFSHVLGREHTG